MSFKLSENDRLYASYAIANKEPDRDDFEANREETPRFEHLGDFELGYDRKGSRYHLHGNLYYMRYKNQLVLTGKINDVGAYTRTNIPHSYRLGVELNGDIQFGRIWTFSANAAFSKNRISHFIEYIDNYDNGGQKAIDHGETDISFSPAVISGASLTATPVKDLSLTFGGKYVSRLYLDNTSEKTRSLDPYLVNSLQAHYTWQPKWISAIQLNLMVNNLFNVQYLTNGYTYSSISNGEIQTANSYFPQAGINYLAGASIEF
jgi:iron complex outermembrane receptor protein